jgi:hypothetical protein
LELCSLSLGFLHHLEQEACTTTPTEMGSYEPIYWAELELWSSQFLFS